MLMYGVAWGSRTVAGVASNGVATQLYPVGVPAAGSCADTSGGWPPAASGLVRRPTAGRASNVHITGDGVNGGYVELWDVGGLDRGASDNVNSGGDTVTNAYLAANGRLLQVINIESSEGQAFAYGSQVINFDRGLAVRYVGSGSVYVAPYCEGGFMVQAVPV